MFIYLSFVILIASDIRESLCGPDSSSSTPNLSKRLSRSWSYQSNSASNTSICDKRKVDSGTPDAHTECHSKCMNTQQVIRAYHRAYPTHTTVTCFYNKCGLANEGKCGYWGLAYYPICLCYTPDGMRNRQKTPLWMCRLAVPILRKVTGDVEKKVGEKDRTDSTEMPILSSIFTSKDDSGKIKGDEKEKKEPDEEEEEEKEEEDEKSGEALIVDLRVLEGRGMNVKAVVDTGASVTLINQKLAGDCVWPLDEGREIRVANNAKLQIFGRTLLFIQTEEGDTFALRGLVTNHHFNIVLGNDFNKDHATKINILERSMSIVYNKREIKMALKFINVKDMMETLGMICCCCQCDVRKPMKVSGWANGYKTKIWIDTGVSRSIVKKSYVKDRNIRQTKHTLFITQDAQSDVIGKTDVAVSLGGKQFSTLALVVKIKVVDSLILGNSFIKPYVELIDFGQKTVTLAPFGDKGRTTVNMIEF